MNRKLRMPPTKIVLAVATVAILSGCASVNLEQNLSSANASTSGFTDGNLTLARDQNERDALRQRASELLSKPLSQKDAVQLALVNSPSMQAIVAQNWADASTAAQSGRIANPLLSLERVRLGSETEIGRLLSFGLLDLLTLPTRKGIAEQRIKQTQLRLSSDVVDQVTQVRQAWVRAVAAQQTLAYTQQVVASAQASAELAKRMQAVGNFNKLDRARQQAFYADTATQLASAQHQVAAAREELVRLLGLDDSQAQQLKLPERLPTLPRSRCLHRTLAARHPRGGWICRSRKPTTTQLHARKAGTGSRPSQTSSWACGATLSSMQQRTPTPRGAASRSACSCRSSTGGACGATP